MGQGKKTKISWQLYTGMVSNYGFWPFPIRGRDKNIALWENLVGRNNQQETRKSFQFLGSSETLRGTFFSYTDQIDCFSKKECIFQSKIEDKKALNLKQKHTKFFSVYNFEAFVDCSNRSKKRKPIPKEKHKFLEWFIGFSEGDGSFGFHTKNGLTFVINQADLKILHQIRTELGFGRLRTFQQQGSIYARYEVKKKEHIYKLIQLFNGNIHLEKVQKRFEFWVNAYNKKYELSGENFIVVKPRLKPTNLNLETAWLSGFWDAEGGFHANIGISKKQNSNKNYSRLRLKTYVDQKEEYEIMKQIQNLFEVPNVTVRSEKKKLYRVDCNSKKTLQKILTYFEIHKVRSKKHTVYNMWKKLVRFYIEGKHLKNFPEMERRVKRIQKQNNLFKNEKSVLSNLPTELSNEILL